jgi:hypothetical protein
MASPSKVALGALATALVAIGVAAQTGTVHFAGRTTPRAAAAMHVTSADHAPIKPVDTASPAPAQPSPVDAQTQDEDDGD